MDVREVVLRRVLMWAVIAQLAFWALMAIGLVSGELDRRSAAVFVALWLVGYFGLPRLFMAGPLFFMSYVAVLDIVLVFIVFKGDVRLGLRK